jgi:DNA-directed RNA polymerase specialized sigma24 family protein
MAIDPGFDLLACKTKSGDKSAIDTLIQRSKQIGDPIFYKLGFKALTEWEDLEDLRCELRKAVYCKLDSMRSFDTFDAFCSREAWALARKARRKKNRQRLRCPYSLEEGCMASNLIPEPVAPARDNPESVALRNEFIHELMNFMCELPLRQRQILALLMDGKSQDEISREMSASSRTTSTTRVQVGNIRRRLNERFDADMP